MSKIIETNRLYLRELIPEDAENLYRLNLDSDVIKFTGDSAFESVQSARDFLKDYNSYTKYGFGRWAVIRKNDDLFLGWCGLKFSPEVEEIDIGFRFLKEYWNNGFATEAAQACLDLGFAMHRAERIVGRAMKSNIGSIRVLEKLGLKFESEFDFKGHVWVKYEVRAGE